MKVSSESQPRRIVHVPRRYVSHEWGGTETVIFESARQQRAMGVDPVILTSMALAGRKREDIGGTEVRRYHHCYPFFGLTDEERAAMDKTGGNLWSGPLYRALLREPGVRLYHAHALKRLGGMVRSAARLRRKPYVVSLHGGVFDVPQEELRSLTAPIKGKVEWGRAIGALLGSRRVLTDADHVICVGQGEADQARRHLEHDRISYLPNGVDTSRFTEGDGPRFRNKHGLAPEAFVVLCVSRIDAQKNQATLIEAFADLHRQSPTARLVLIGPETQPDYGTRIREVIAERGVEDAVLILPGLCNQSSELVDAYHAADVFVLPSRHEPFGIVVLEAWCAGKPVIASEVGGLRSLVRDGVNGFSFHPEARHASMMLAAQMARLRDDPAMRGALGEAGRHEARSRYDWKSIAGELEVLYQRAEEHLARKEGRKP